jgi:Family of unknown function (DUF5684)
MNNLNFLLIIPALVGAWNVFEKAGRSGWEALVPIYNIYVLTVITGQSGWLVLLCLIPLINVVAIGFLYWKLAERFTLSWPFAIGLLLLPFLFLPVLGFGEYRYTPLRSGP